MHAFRDVLRNELANCAPQVGDKITIAYGGKSETGYFRYRVRHADGRSRQVNWARFADEAPPAEPDVLIAAEDLRKPPAPSSPSEQAERFGDDIPWDD